MLIPLNIESLITSIAVAAVIFLGTTILKSVRAIDRLTEAVGKIAKLEADLVELREWCIRNGFDRRQIDRRQIDHD